PARDHRRHSQLSQPHVRRRSLQRPSLHSIDRSEPALLRRVVHLPRYVCSIPGIAAFASDRHRRQRHQPPGPPRHRNLRRNQLQSLAGSGGSRRYLFRNGRELPLLSVPRMRHTHALRSRDRPAAASFALLLALSVVQGAWAGVIEQAAPAATPATIEVDAREAPRGIMTAHLKLPVTAGPLTLVYPKWLPGRHSPAGPLTSLGGPRFTAAGHTLAWRRDAVDMNAFHLEIPAGVSLLDADLEMLTAPAPDGVVKRVHIDGI